MEIERKFLVKELPENLESFPHDEIQQGYLATMPTIRIRRIGSRHIFTIKEHVSNNGAVVNREEEFIIASTTFEELLPKCDGRIVTKIRYRIPLGAFVAELDVFSGRHTGLNMVEVEFPDIDTALSFIPPKWFGKEVSGDPHYSNAYLSTHSIEL